MRHATTGRSGTALLAALLVACCANAAEGDAQGKVRIPAHARIGNAAVAGAQFEFGCTTGEGGALQIALILPPPEAIRSFKLDEFEGPDGIGEMHKLAEWSVSGGKHPARMRSSISGWRGVDGDGFLLATARESAHSSDLARLAGHLVASDQARLRLVVKPVHAGEALKVEAAVDGHREAIENVVAPCLKPAK